VHTCITPQPVQQCVPRGLDCNEACGCPAGPIFGIPSASMVRQPLSLLIPALEGKTPEEALLADDTKKGALKAHSSSKMKVGPPKKFTVRHADRHALHLQVQVRAPCTSPSQPVALQLVAPPVGDGAPPSQRSRSIICWWHNKQSVTCGGSYADVVAHATYKQHSAQRSPSPANDPRH
jgi:hypothetical protein